MKNKFKVREDQTRTSSPTFHNESTQHNPTLQPNHMHMQGVRARESMKTTEWTDEKHSMYLKSIEASFVNQLYDSKHIIANSLPRSKGGTTHDPALTSGQFKVLRGGSWQKINFERENNPQQMGRNNNQCQYDLTSNPWIQHYRCSSKQRSDVAVAVPSLQESVTSTSRVADLSQRKKGGVSSGTRQLHQSHVSHQDMLSSDTEMSDQNFVDEEVEAEKETKRNKVKRHKSLIIDAKGNDQMVPSKSSSMEYVSKNYYPATQNKRGYQKLS